MALHDLVVIGGGAAGFFGAIRYAELHPSKKITILEKSARTLDKVRISGGGRCNVTHACFDPDELVQHYPRGSRELLGPFHRFQCGDTMAWFGERGVETKIEDDGRVFPVTDQSSSIIDCFWREIKRLGVEVKPQTSVTALESVDGAWRVTTTSGSYLTRAVLVTTGSAPSFWQLLEGLGVECVKPVPSLFTFNTKHPLLTGLMGLSVPWVEARIAGGRLHTEGPLLITHWGLSGPAVLRLSAWGARELAQRNWNFTAEIDFSGGMDVDGWLAERRSADARKKVRTTVFPTLPRRLWERMAELTGTADLNWADLRTSDLDALRKIVAEWQTPVTGKSTFKDEFVTACGVDLKQINFKTMEHKTLKGLFFAGEVLDIDAITGGFNFQAAWTTSWIAAESIP